MVTLTSRESTVQHQLTPKFPIKRKSKTSVFTRGVTVFFYAENRPAFSPLDLRGVWVDGGPIRGERALEMKYVLGGCDCPTAAYLICTSSLLPGYATMKSISTTPGHQSLRLPLGWPACSWKAYRVKKRKQQHIFQKRAWVWIVPTHFWLHNASYQCITFISLVF